MAKITIAEFAKKSKRRIGDTTKSIIFEVAKGVTEKTPVGNPDEWIYPAPSGYVGGQAKGNWIPSIGTPSKEVRLNKKDNSPLGQPADITDTIGLADDAVGGKFFLSNNLPYIRRLEYEAWSRRSPEGMTTITVAEIQRGMQQIINDVK